jgi:hypothetical protein
VPPLPIYPTVNAQLRLPLPLPLVLAVAGAVAAALFLFVARPGSGDMRTDAGSNAVAREATARGTGAPAANVAGTGAPAALVRALKRHRVVVVALALPNVTLDREASNEARAGARMARVGFVALSARARKSATFAKKLGLTTTPGVVVVDRKFDVRIRIEGFADAASIEQAARGALR